MLGSLLCMGCSVRNTVTSLVKAILGNVEKYILVVMLKFEVSKLAQACL